MPRPVSFGIPAPRKKSARNTWTLQRRRFKRFAFTTVAPSRGRRRLQLAVTTRTKELLSV
jgi:hypothetical protein